MPAKNQNEKYLLNLRAIEYLRAYANLKIRISDFSKNTYISKKLPLICSQIEEIYKDETIIFAFYTCFKKLKNQHSVLSKSKSYKFQHKLLCAQKTLQKYFFFMQNDKIQTRCIRLIKKDNNCFNNTHKKRVRYALKYCAIRNLCSLKIYDFDNFDDENLRIYYEYFDKIYMNSNDRINNK